MFDFLKLKRVWVTLLVVLALGGVSLWYISRDSDEAQIRWTLKELCRIASKHEGEQTGTLLLKTHAVENVFGPNCRIDFHHEQVFVGNYTLEELQSLLARSRMFFKTCDVEVRDLSITVTPPDKATVYLTGTLDGVLKSGTVVNEVRDLKCTLKKLDGHWKITDISVRDVLEK